jgi:hypothetical protein
MLDNEWIRQLISMFEKYVQIIPQFFYARAYNLFD